MPNVKELDFFRMKLQNNKAAAFYVRDGKAFYYVGPDRFDVDSAANAVNYGKKALEENFDYDEEFKTMDLSKDLLLKGKMNLLQIQEYFILMFIDSSKQHCPIVIRAGNALENL
ncbi:hypothetical protein N1M2_143 [Klebsiella phage N1M2]|uniref:Uncharacterized protein n=1 Tax=Klebsiella phage N1M2 TaxID=2664939 RepID=A0A6B7ZEV6_9CAUD|nr:hypothetical protein PQB72_gp143 [Klebsiella phage N1M2]QGH72006.1 hypothetical protein N1M2_143 [Klebsiella phage N1M2]